MVSLERLHHFPGDLFGNIATSGLLTCQDVLHVGGLVDGENMELRAVPTGVYKHYRGHGGFFS
jgi:hypothetical protein